MRSTYTAPSVPVPGDTGLLWHREVGLPGQSMRRVLGLAHFARAGGADTGGGRPSFLGRGPDRSGPAKVDGGAASNGCRECRGIRQQLQHFMIQLFAIESLLKQTNLRVHREIYRNQYF